MEGDQLRKRSKILNIMAASHINKKEALFIKKAPFTKFHHPLLKPFFKGLTTK